MDVQSSSSPRRFESRHGTSTSQIRRLPPGSALPPPPLPDPAPSNPPRPPPWSSYSSSPASSSCARGRRPSSASRTRPTASRSLLHSPATSPSPPHCPPPQLMLLTNRDIFSWS
ncbi:unnamed protein product [Triticum turgidum subsp. durum]|uniref:Uncharacterized protein n=1 Tax=Triticum turgidum subsp. durum TaxID=4567 RepID=A0A9R1S8J3_TRITD|nr:unnamed protein product [Triticum turgidum subsp. durum]